jgi:catechol 2,3-dioxygenase-like lactoylglutathione lyase family enzyme
MRIDHVIYATRDLDRAAARLESELGVSAVKGGRHDGLGTHNQIVPLGGGYLELLAVCDPDEAARSDLGAALRTRIEQRGEGLMGWAVALDDVKPVAARLGTPITTIARQGMTAQLTGLTASLRQPFLPFFITRDSDVEDPGAAGGAGSITWIEVAGDRGHLERWLGGGELPVRITQGPPGVRAVGIGERELRT